MNKLLKYLIYLLLVSFILGPLGALPLSISQVNVYFTDIIIGLICLAWTTSIKKAVRLIKIDPIARYFCLFVVVSVISLIFSPIHMKLGEKLISGLYIVRLFAYFFVYLTVRNLIKEKMISAVFVTKLLAIVGLILAGIGWLQYFLYPDLRNLYYLGWDPHYKRMFSTFLDPNYFGLLLILSLILLLKSFTPAESPRNTPGVFLRIIKLLFVFAALMFTYSRSSYLALIVAGIYFSTTKKNLKLLGGILLAILVSALLLPRSGGIGVQLERVFSLETRIENWQQAIKIFMDHTVLGTGFNAVRYAKNQYNFNQDNLSVNHAGAGFDNSFLFIAATTGLSGLVTYLLFLLQSFKNSSTIVRTSLIAIITHSIFVNSLFLPWIMLWMWVLLGMNFRE